MPTPGQRYTGPLARGARGGSKRPGPPLRGSLSSYPRGRPGAAAAVLSTDLDLDERGELGEGGDRVDDRLGRRAVEAEQLVHEAAGDAEHGGAAVLALDVQLVRALALLVPHPARAADVARLLVGLL